jgi:NAD(P)-dependent dehydrogenase (short-subunit alcohol dehydrogenase family)
MPRVCEHHRIGRCSANRTPPAAALPALSKIDAQAARCYSREAAASVTVGHTPRLRPSPRDNVDPAMAALFLASDAARWMTGVTLDVAAGRITM